MNQDNKIYMNQIWHKIEREKIVIENSKAKTKRQNFISLISTVFIIILSLCLVYKVELLEGFSIVIALIIISTVTYSEYMKIKGDTYDF